MAAGTLNLGSISIDASPLQATGKEINNVINYLDKMSKKVSTIEKSFSGFKKTGLSDIETQMKTLNQTATKMLTSIQTGFTGINKINTSGFKSVTDDISNAAKKMADNVAKSATKTREAVKQTTNKSGSGKTLTAEEQDLKEIIRLYKEYYSVMAQLSRVRGSGTNQNEVLNTRLSKIKEELTLYQKVVPGLVQYAQTLDVVAKAEHSMKLASAKKTDTAYDKEQQTQKQQAITALKEWQNLNQKMVGMDRSSQQFAELSRQAETARAKFMGFSKEIRNSKEVMDEYNASVKKTQDAKSWVTANTNQTAYDNALRERVRLNKELISLESKPTTKRTSAEDNRILTLKTRIQQVQQQINTLERSGVSNEKLKETTEREITDAKEQQAIAQQRVASAEEAALNRLMTMVRTYVVLRGLRTLWRNAVEYATEYYDKLNEIQIVTQKSDSSMAKISDTFKNMAKELHISSTDIATAATTFYRQGLDEGKTETRTKWASMYAKITAQSFDEAATQVTASVNSMGISAQEAVDVFTYLGDNSASSGAEIGEAMQKAAAAAAEFGLDFKTLGAYIATVSETTRQEASTIGTAFNSIFARWHNIKKTGFSLDDDGNAIGTNDIQKALSNVGISLFDQNNNWRDMGKVLDELAGKWSGLDSVTKSYIATTIAGTKQQNVFLALMRDMSKGVEGGSRAYELYNGALNAAGTVEEKYATYLNSVTAAQDGMNVSLERLYETIVNSDDLKNFYNIMSNLADAAAAGMEIFGGMALRVVAVAAAAGSLVFIISQIAQLITALKGAKGIEAVLGVLTGGKLMLAVAAISAVVAGVVTLVGAIKNATDETAKLKKRLQEITAEKEKITSEYSSLKSLRDEYSELASTTDRTKEQQTRLEAIWKQLKSFSPTLALALAQVSGGYDNQTAVVAALNGEMERLLGNYQKLSQEEAKQKAKEIVEDFKTGYANAKGFDNVFEQRKSLNVAFNSQYGIEKLLNSYGSYKNGKKTQAALSLFYDYDNKRFNDTLYEYFLQDGEDLNDIIAAKGGNMLEVAAEAAKYVETEFKRVGMSDTLYNTIMDEYNAFIKRTGESISLTDFIMKVFSSDDAGLSLDTYVKQYVDGFYETLFTALASPDYYAGTAAGQEGYKSAFKETLKQTLISMGFSGDTIESLIKDLLLNGDSLDISKVMANMALRMSGVTAQIEKQPWYESWNNAMQYVIESYNPNDTTAFDENYKKLAVAYHGYMAQYGDGFTTYYKNMPTKKSLIEQAKGISDVGEAAEATSESVETLREKIAKLITSQVEDNNIQKLKDNGFETWLNEISNNASQNGTGLDRAKSIVAWMDDGKSEGEWKAFLSMYSEFADDFAAINEAVASGNEQDAAAAVQNLVDHIAESKDKMLQAAKEYADAQKTLTEAEGNALIKEIATRKIDDSEGVIHTFDDLSSEKIAYLTDNSAAFQHFLSALNEYNNATTNTEKKDALGKMTAALAEFDAEANAIDLTDLTAQIENVGKSGDTTAQELQSAYTTLYDYADKWYEAQTELETIQKKMASGENVLYSDVSQIASFLNMSPEAVLANWEAVPDLMAQSVKKAKNLMQLLNDAYAASVLGMTTDTFEGIKNGKIIVDDLTEEARTLLTLSGQWRVVQQEVTGKAKFADGKGGQKTDDASGMHWVLEATNLNAFSESGRKEDDYLSAIATLKKSQESQKLSDEKYNSWLTKLSGILNNTSTDNAAKAKAVYDWVSGLDTDQFNAFIQMYPELAAGLEALYNAGNDGGDAATNLEEFANTVDAAANQMIQALTSCGEAKKSITDEEGNSLIQSLAGKADTENPVGFMNTILQEDGMDASWLINNSEAIRSYTEAYERYTKAAEGSDEAKDALNDMRKAIDALQKESRKITLASLQNDIKNLGKTADSTATDILNAYKDVYSFADDYYEASQELAQAQELQSSGTELTLDNVQKIASVLSMSPQAVLASWGQIPRMMQDVANSGLQAINDLNENAFFTITGTSDVDFSTLMNSIMVVDDMSAEMLDQLLKTGQFEVQTIDLKQTAYVWNAQKNGFDEMFVSGQAQVLKPTGANPFSGTGRKTTSSGGGGGGGGGGGSKNSDGKTAEELFVERTNESLQRISDTMSQLSTITERYDSQGYFTAEANALEKMNTMLESQSEILRTKLEEAKAMLPGLYDELSKAKPDTEAYAAIQGRIETIQSAVVDWTQKLEENTSSIISNKEKIDDLYDSIRDLEIGLENEILEAIENREDKQEKMQNARISMEETILDVLKEQAEKAEKEITDSIDKQVDALNKEKDAISEILEKRKEQADEEDKLQQLQELQAKYARISADPTRAKEAASILDDIRDLQKEIAWSQTEKEAEEQQKSIDQQIESLEDYKEETEKYYEELLKNPRNFMEQVEEIMKKSSGEIVEWLKENSEDYKNALDSSREDMKNGWEDTLNEMNGIFESHWDEVQEIIQGGDDAIIEFLKNNATKYEEASKLQQEAYLKGWKETLENIKKAHEEMDSSLLDNSGFVSTVTTGKTDGDKSSGSGNGNGSGIVAKTGYKITGIHPTSGYQEARFEAAKYGSMSKAKQIAQQVYESEKNRVIDGKKWQNLKVTAYKTGGMVYDTGLIQIDGTKTKPERILSPYQTELFEALVRSMESMNRINTPSMRYYGDTPKNENAGTTLSMGDLIINVDQIATDDDYETIAEKVKESIVESITNGRAIGGITR